MEIGQRVQIIESDNICIKLGRQEIDVLESISEEINIVFDCMLNSRGIVLGITSDEKRVLVKLENIDDDEFDKKNCIFVSIGDIFAIKNNEVNSSTEVPVYNTFSESEDVKVLKISIRKIRK